MQSGPVSYQKSIFTDMNGVQKRIHWFSDHHKKHSECSQHSLSFLTLLMDSLKSASVPVEVFIEIGKEYRSTIPKTPNYINQLVYRLQHEYNCLEADTKICSSHFKQDIRFHNADLRHTLFNQYTLVVLPWWISDGRHLSNSQERFKQVREHVFNNALRVKITNMSILPLYAWIDQMICSRNQRLRMDELPISPTLEEFIYDFSYLLSHEQNTPIHALYPPMVSTVPYYMAIFDNIFYSHPLPSSVFMTYFRHMMNQHTKTEFHATSWLMDIYTSISILSSHANDIVLYVGYEHTNFIQNMFRDLVQYQPSCTLVESPLFKNNNAQCISFPFVIQPLISFYTNLFQNMLPELPPYQHTGRNKKSKKKKKHNNK